jgi:hypothetical protein
VIQPIVEGHAEIEALPVLLRRMCAEAEAFHVQIGVPIRRHRSQLVQRESLEKAVKIARRQPECRAILIVFDGDRDCPREVGPRIQGWAQTMAGEVPCFVVVPHREYEAWFLAAIESLRGRRSLRTDAVAPPQPEEILGTKEALEAQMIGATYHGPADQPAFSALFDLAAAYRVSRSFRRMTTAFGQMLQAEGIHPALWPPASWNV